MYQHRFSGMDAMGTVQQILGGRALQHAGRRGLVVDTQRHCGDVTAHRQRGVEDAVGGHVVAIRQRQQLLADHAVDVEEQEPHLAGRLRRSGQR